MEKYYKEKLMREEVIKFGEYKQVLHNKGNSK